MNKQIIQEKTAALRQQIIDTICDLVSIPTVNPPGRCYDQCTQYLSKLLSTWGIEHQVITVPSPGNERFSIIGSCGAGADGLHFHGHYDVVPAASAEQFRPHIEDNLLFGRGSADMKSGVAAMLYAIHIIKESGIRLQGKITFSIVPDEETGGKLGIEYLFNSGLLPIGSLSGMLMPEPTSGLVWNASKGALSYRIDITGKTAHAALAHQGINSFENMVTLANALLKLKKKVAGRKTKMSIDPAEANRSVLLIGGEAGSGFNFNTVPERSFFTIDRRFNPEEKLEQVRQELYRLFDRFKRMGMKLAVEVLQQGDSSFSSSETRAAMMLKQSVTEVTGKEPGFKLCPGLIETRFFSRLGIPAYAYGPGLLDHAHSPAEYVDINSVLNCTAIYALTALRLLT